MHVRQFALIAIALLSSLAYAEEKTALGTAIETISPVTQAAGEYVSRSIMQGLAENDTPLGKVARQQLKQAEKQERKDNRSTRRTMQECIKPGNVIDEDVQECIMGMRQRDW